MRDTLIASLLVMTMACVDMPGDAGEGCNPHGLCAAGLVCLDNTCVASSAADAGPGTDAAGSDAAQEDAWEPPSFESLCDGADEDYDGTIDEEFCPNFGECSATEAICLIVGAAECGYYVAGSSDQGAHSEMCRVSAGDYDVGPTPTVVHNIPADFFIDRYEVTSLRYRAFFRDHPTEANRPDCFLIAPGHVSRTWSHDEPFLDAAFDQHPVVCVNHSQAEAFCAWAGKQLATDREWEVAARGPDALLHTYPWGNSDPTSITANCMDGSCSQSHPDTSPVETLPDGASPAGCFHMAGNAAEWAVTYDSAVPIVMGGSWDDTAEDIHVWSSDDRAETSAVMTVGFRCAYELVP